jgi:SAM-dependent methyltransferase
VFGALAHAQEKTGGPFVPTPQGVVDAMLELANVGPDDLVIDLGSGDGRIVLTAARRYGAGGVGFDIDPELVEQSNARARKMGLADRVRFEQQDVLQARIADASVVTLYLLPGMMQSLQSKFIRELKPGTRIVSHDFPMPDWKPDRESAVDVDEKYGSPGSWRSTVFYWVVPAQVQGTWSLAAPALANEPVPLTLHQRYQMLEGSAVVTSRPLKVSTARIEGRRVRFIVAAGQGSYEFQGVVEGDTIRGEVVHAGRASAWTAQRVNAAALAALP